MPAAPPEGAVPGPRPSPTLLLASAVVVLVAGAGVLGAGLAAEVARTDERADVADRAVAMIAPTISTLEEAVDDARSRAAAAVAGATVAGTTTVGVGEVPDGVPPSVLGAARDTGDVRVVSGGGAVTAVFAVFDSPTGATLEAPVTTQLRRAGVAGYVLGPVDLSGVAGAATPGTWYRLSLDGTEAAASDGTPGARRSTERAAFDVAGSRWHLSVSAVDSATGFPLLGMAALATSAVVIAVFAVQTRNRVRLERRTATQRRRADQRFALLSSLAPVMQETLELDTVLPATIVALHDHFDLRGAGVSLSTGAGEIDVFSTGDATTPGNTVLRGERIEPEQLRSFPLERGPRHLGHLNVRSRHSHDTDDVAVMRMVADLLTGVLVTSAAFDQQAAATQRLRELDEMKTVFLATASHELRTPITAVSGFSSLLESRWDDLTEDDRRNFAERIRVNAGALESLVTQLLDVARIEQGLDDEALEVLDVSATVTDLLPQLETQVVDHELVSAVQRGLWAKGSTQALDRILSNLVSNAAKYSPAGSRIELRVVAEDDTVRVLVDDQGPGVDADERERIFSRFYRGGSDEVLRTRGAGIGLSVATDFALHLGGELTVEDAPSGGARFCLSLPRLPDPRRGGSDGE